MSFHINAPRPTQVDLVRLPCPTCGLPRRMVGTSYEWYSGTLTCLRCGDEWGEDGRLPRPFRRGWKRDRIRQAWNTFARFRRAAHQEQHTPET